MHEASTWWAGEKVRPWASQWDLLAAKIVSTGSLSIASASPAPCLAFSFSASQPHWPRSHLHWPSQPLHRERWSTPLPCSRPLTAAALMRSCSCCNSCSSCPSCANMLARPLPCADFKAGSPSSAGGSPSPAHAPLCWWLCVSRLPDLLLPCFLLPAKRPTERDLPLFSLSSFFK